MIVTKPFCAAAIIGLSACSADISVAKRELQVLDDNSNVSSAKATYEEVVEYGRDLTNGYLEEAAIAARGRDTAFLGLLAIGTFAGYRAVDGASATELARTALFGAAANQAASFYSPGSSAQKLVRGANRMICVVNVGASYNTDLDGSSFKAPAKTLMLATIDKIRAILRGELANQLVDYSTIANAIEQAVEENEKTDEPTKEEVESAKRAQSIARTFGAARNSRNLRAIDEVAMKAFAKMKVDLEKCPAA